MLYRLFFLLLAAACLFNAKRLYFMNQGDFDRMAWYFLEKPLDASHRLWQFKAVFEEMRLDIPGWIFAILANFQKLYWPEYSLAFSSLVGQLCMLAYAHLLSRKISALAGLGLASRAALLLIFAASFFYAHNIAMLSSLYGEYVFMLALPALILGFIWLEVPNGSVTAYFLVLLATFFMGMAKTQYFYVPFLVAVTFLLIALLDKRKPAYPLIAALLAVQAVCLIPLQKNNFAQLNYYHSLYFGSYLVLDESELSRLALPLENTPCIGTDAWGNRISGDKGEKVEMGGTSCYKKQELQIGDVLRPYILFPLTLPKMIHYSEVHWGTVRYVHIYADSFYVKSTLGPVDSKNILVRLSSIRDVIFSGYVLVVLACLGLACAFGRRLDGFVRYPSFFLGALFLSQLLASLLGEGVRDLGKHMWAAQFSVDVMVALWLASGVRKLARRTALPRASPPTV